MLLRLHNELTGKVEDLNPVKPPQCRLWIDLPPATDLEAFRRIALGEMLKEALTYMGYEPVPAKTELDLSFGGPRPSGGHWLKPAGVDGAGPERVQEYFDKGFTRSDLGLLFARTHYRRPLKFSWRALEDARGERAALRSAAASLAARAGASAPNATGLAGYKKRFRDALARDFDLPEAVEAMWDALRPGALSPGSQLGALRDADSVLGLLRDG